ncbi:Glu/Leu/Phe/Val family dehydrogenase [Altererythrobacter sp. Root672]|uniref:Glu/Leu/Phe/Val family dehydrogenase n=1 Tax=Altererythrobacter sp. Root672 TaxID=1736584 RepID=UPI0006F5EE53|nr:Glu/Leu/Phe/Val dehydrogenase dimerization domain-containing protein [Altererythrobacter sp. Root672]KRA82654.1 amino acid dehydrogenase [Altererythrobacter sp. Root672]
MFKFVSAAPPESVHVLRDPSSGLDGVIVLHSTRRGPAAGGCRLWSYSSSTEAAKDAARLAEGMAYKNALADLPLGGGKAVLRLPPGPFDRRSLFQAFGREVAKLQGSYVTAEDVGTTVSDMQIASGTCRHVAGLTAVQGRPGGDPSPWTALGVFISMQEAVRRKFGADLKGMTVAVQGLGSVGSHLCGLLHGAGVKLVVAEPRSDVVARVACRYEATIVGLDAILDTKCEIFAPCALGAVIDEHAVKRLRARIVCGGANNVLATDEDGYRLADRGVLYAPDYVVNAGGIINVAAEYLGWNTEEAEMRVRQTGQRLTDVLDFADRKGLASHHAANDLARQRITASQPGWKMEVV